MAVPTVLIVLLFAVSAISQKVVDLSGNDWTLENLPMNISVPGSVPSQAHLDLYAAQVIGDPYARLDRFALLKLTSRKVLWLERLQLALGSQHQLDIYHFDLWTVSNEDLWLGHTYLTAM